MEGASLELEDESDVTAKSTYRSACLRLMQDRLSEASSSTNVPNVSEPRT